MKYVIDVIKQDNYPGVADPTGWYLVDSSDLVYNNGATYQRIIDDTVVGSLKNFQAEVDKQNNTALIVKEGMISALEKELDQLKSRQAAQGNTDSDTLLKAIAIAQNPELIKEIL